MFMTIIKVLNSVSYLKTQSELAMDIVLYIGAVI